MLFLLLGLAFCKAQQAGDDQDGHPSMPYQDCSSGTCQTKQTSIVLDANWRWVHNVGGYTNCYDGDEWDQQYCPSSSGGGVQCAANCALEGVSTSDYQATYGITTDGQGEARLGFVTQGAYGKNIGSRTYLLSESKTQYEMFYLLNKQFEFEVDVSTLDCGLNGALYFVGMDATGGTGSGNNKAGAAYGTGYCDAQCPQDIKFISGEGNCEDWTPSSNNPNTGDGKYGSCCQEMDIWEANRISTAVTPHACDGVGPYRCDGETGSECGNADGTRYDSWCDADGCDFNPWRVGDHTFYGNSSNFTINTQEKMTVITQFLTNDGTDEGDLVEIRRFFQQGDNTWELPSAVDVNEKYNSITDSFCLAEESAFGDKSQFEAKGGLKAMGEQMKEGMVLVMSLWDDYSVDMLWLDSCYPTDVPCTDPGVSRGSCPTNSGEPVDVEDVDANSYTTFANIKLGAIQTYN